MTNENQFYILVSISDDFSEIILSYAFERTHALDNTPAYVTFQIFCEGHFFISSSAASCDFVMGTSKNRFHP